MRHFDSCWFNHRDPIGILVSLLGYVHIGFTSFCTLYCVIYSLYGFSPRGLTLMVLMTFFIFMVVWCGVKASFTEPGLVVNPIKVSEEARAYYLEEASYNYCEKCDCMKPARAHHCSKCNVCILKMDHHCPWINNCVGARNQKYFILYLIYVHFGVVLASILGCGFIYEKRFEIYENTVIVYLRELDPFNEFIPSWIANHIFLPFFDADILLDILTIIEVFFSSIFAVFVLFLLFDQIKAIRYDLTYVEYLKSYRVHTLENSFFDCLVSTMGEPPSWRWLFPIEGKYMSRILKKLSNEFICAGEDDLSSEEETSMEEKKNQ